MWIIIHLIIYFFVVIIKINTSHMDTFMVLHCSFWSCKAPIPIYRICTKKNGQYFSQNVSFCVPQKVIWVWIDMWVSTEFEYCIQNYDRFKIFWVNKPIFLISLLILLFVCLALSRYSNSVLIQDGKMFLSPCPFNAHVNLICSH